MDMIQTNTPNSETAEAISRLRSLVQRVTTDYRRAREIQGDQRKDTDGKPIVSVPIGAGEAVKLFPEDFSELQRQGMAHGWYMRTNGRGGRYVGMNLHSGSGHKSVTIARLIVRAVKGEAVCYRDGNPLNLRRDNLYIPRGRVEGFAARLNYATSE